MKLIDEGDRQYIEVSTVLIEVAQEQDRQLDLRGEQNHPDMADEDDEAQYLAASEMWKAVNELREELDTTCWDGILLEEVYEALSAESVPAMREELVQVAAVATSWVEAIDRRAEVVE